MAFTINFISKGNEENSKCKEVLEYHPNDRTIRRLDVQDEKSDLTVFFNQKYRDFVKKQFFNQKAPTLSNSSSFLDLPLSFNPFISFESLFFKTLKELKRNNVDHMIGLVISIYLYINTFTVFRLAKNLYQVYALDVTTNYIRWLMGWPAGLKLNSNLDKFLGEMFLWLLDCWSTFFVDKMTLILPIVYYMGIASAFFVGISPLIALLSDLLLIFSTHFILFFRIASRLYSWQVKALLSLFHLFRGKKWNTLRNRLDSNDYEMDQLLLGTVLFTLLFFGFPTIAVYYVLFGIAKLMTFSTLVILRFLLSLLVSLRSEQIREEAVVSGFYFDKLSNSQYKLIVEESSVMFSPITKSLKSLKFTKPNLLKLLLGQI
jgi:hypothetical protein